MISTSKSARDNATLANVGDALRSDDCPVPETFLMPVWSALDAARRMSVQTHVADCAACQVERRLAQSFEDDEAATEVTDLARRVHLPKDSELPAPETNSDQRLGAPWRGLLAATVAACAIGLGAIVMRDDATLPELPERDVATSIVRGAQIRLLPQAAALGPDANVMRWSQVDGTAQYKIAIRNAATETVWTIQTPLTRAALPNGLIESGGKFRWDVLAYDDQGKILAQSAEGIYIYDRGGEP